MWTSYFALILLVDFGESGYNWNTQSSTSYPKQRPISNDEWDALNGAMNGISARHGSQRPKFNGADDMNTLTTPKIGASSNKDFHRQMSRILSKYPGAVYSTVGPDGTLISGKVGEEDPNPRYAADGPSSNYAYENYNPAPLPRPPPIQQSASSRYNNPLSSSSYQPEPAVASPRRNFGINQNSRQGNDYSQMPQQQSNNFSPRPDVQNDFSNRRTQPQRENVMQQPQPIPPSRDSRLDTQYKPENDYNSEPTGGEHDINPVTPFLGNGQGLRKGGTQDHNDEDNGGVLGGGLFGGGQEQKSSPKPISTFDPKDGGQAAENLASAITGQFNYYWKTQRRLGGNTPFYLEQCDKAVSNQEPAMKEMKRSDRTLMNIMKIWEKSLENQLSNFFINVVGANGFAEGGKQMESLMTLMKECVRPKLVLTKV